MIGGLEKLRSHLPHCQAEDSLLLTLLEDAKNMILVFTGRQEMPKALENTQLRLAVVLYNRLGTEGETSRGEGDVQSTFSSFPENIKGELLPFRLVRTGGI